MIMKVNAFTDLARSALTQMQSRALKTDQTKLSLELASGQTTDPVQHLKSDLSVLADITQKSSVANQFLSSNREIEHMLDASQVVFKTIQSSTESLLNALTIGMQTGLPHAPDQVGAEANAALANTINALNTNVAGRHIFSGQTTDRQPLVSVEDFKNIVDAELTGATSAIEIQDRVDAFFADGGGFDLLVYQGSDNSLEAIKTSETGLVQMSVRADNQAFRETLKSAILARAAAELPGFTYDMRTEVFNAAQTSGLQSKDLLLNTAAQVGVSQHQLEQSQAELQAQIAASELVRTELLSVDAYETASKLEDINTRLELLYTVTARTRNLSFLEFMR